MEFLINAAQVLVDYKLDLDTQLSQFHYLTKTRRARAERTGIQRPDEYFCRNGHLASIDPTTFARLVLPFSEPICDYETAVCMRVNPTQVISGTYMIYEELSHSSAHKQMDYLDHLAEHERFDSDTARFAQIGSLPLYVALEGKNRVSLYRREKRDIKALVTPTPWPEAHELTVRIIKPFGFVGLSYRDCFEILPFPEAAVPLLRAYGVRFDGRVWNFSARRTWRAKRTAITSNLMVS